MTTLLDEHDGLLVDLDGTLYRGGTAVPGATAILSRAAERGHRVGYLTNNGARGSAQVAAHLAELGFRATEADIVTSGQAAGRMLAERLPAGAAVLVVGTEDLRREVRDAGLTVTEHADVAHGVGQGHSSDTGWAQLAEACLAIRHGALWVTCNLDATLPTERGLLPGNGAMVAALRAATGQEPVVAGKPEPWVFTEAVRRTGARRPLVVGDRLDTDIAGANAAGLPSVAVLSGVSDAAAVLHAVRRHRPRYLGADVTVLDEERDVAEVVARPPWTVRSDDSGLLLAAGAAGPGADPVAALRALCQTHWAGDGGPVRVRAGDQTAASALRELGLGGE